MWRSAGVASLMMTWPTLLTAQADDAYIKKARSAAPASISAQASVARLSDKGEVSILAKGTNGFTCVVGVPGDPEAPFCADKAAMQWLVDAAMQKPAPTITTPGIAYMAQGGVHHETPDGQIVMAPGSNTTAHKEPPHWMLFYPFDPVTSGIPAKENPSGTYIMFAGTPYAHLMIYQDPMKMTIKEKR